MECNRQSTGNTSTYFHNVLQVVTTNKISFAEKKLNFKNGDTLTMVSHNIIVISEFGLYSSGVYFHYYQVYEANAKWFLSKNGSLRLKFSLQ